MSNRVILKPHRGNINTMNNDKSNIILQDGELFIEKQEDNSYKFKIGDGTTIYSELPYSGGGEIIVDNILSSTSTNPICSSAVYNEISTLQSNFQDGCNSIASAVTAKGQTPASNSLNDIITAINNITTSSQGDIDRESYYEYAAELHEEESLPYIKYTTGLETTIINGVNLTNVRNSKPTDILFPSIINNKPVVLQ